MFTVQLVDRKTFANRYYECQSVESNEGFVGLYGMEDGFREFDINEKAEYITARIFNSKGVELFSVQGEYIGTDNKRKSINLEEGE